MRNKTLCIVILLTLLLTIILTSCGNRHLKAKDGEPADGFLWVNDYSEIVITGYEGASNDIIIPETINGKPVTKIKSGAFEGFASLKSVEIPGNVKTIEGAFKNCSGLETVIMEEGIENLSSAFINCDSLKSVEIPSTAKETNSAFEDCSELSSVKISDGVEDISSAFKNCDSLKSIEIPESVKRMSRAFEGCAILDTVNIPSKVESLAYTFHNCESLVSIVIPQNIVRLEKTFTGCTSLVDIKLNEGLTEIDGAFGDCSSLKKLEIPEGVTVMSDPFEGCVSLETIVLPKSYKERLSFEDLESIKTVTMSQESLAKSLSDKQRNIYELSNYIDEDWYKKLMNIGNMLSSSGYYYRPDEFEINNMDYDRILNYGDDNKTVEPYVEGPETEGLDTITKYYYLVLDSDKNPYILCHTTIETLYVYANSVGDLDSVVINGVEYSVNQ